MGLFRSSKPKPKSSSSEISAAAYVPPEVSDTSAEVPPIERKDSPDISAGSDDDMLIINTPATRTAASTNATVPKEIEANIPADSDIPEEAPANNTPSPVSMAVKTGKDIGTATIAKARQVAEDGPLSFRVLAFLGGCFMMVTSVLSIFSDVFTLSIMSGLISFYAFVFGAFIVVLEGKVFLSTTTTYQQTLFSVAKILKFVWGRGLLYIFAGTLQLSQMTFLNMISGGYMVCIGIISLIVGRSTSNKLKQLRSAIVDEEALRQTFQTHDKDMDGHLSNTEFQSMIIDLGLEMNHNELVAAFVAIDEKDTGNISLDNFKSWWGGVDPKGFENNSTGQIV